MRKNIAKLALLTVPVLFVVQAGLSADTTKVSTAEPATGEEIIWQVISSGGTEGISASYDMRGTLGQPAVGYGSSPSYGLSQGFWQDFGCCEQRGDADHSGAINVADLTYLVNYLFFSGLAPPCEEEGDVDGNGAINVADVTYLVEYIFFGGPAPPPCP